MLVSASSAHAANFDIVSLSASGADARQSEVQSNQDAGMNDHGRVSSTLEVKMADFQLVMWSKFNI